MFSHPLYLPGYILGFILSVIFLFWTLRPKPGERNQLMVMLALLCIIMSFGPIAIRILIAFDGGPIASSIPHAESLRAAP